jgi:hypothetical protein
MGFGDIRDSKALSLSKIRFFRYRNAIRNVAISYPFPNGALWSSWISERINSCLWTSTGCSEFIMLSLFLWVGIPFLTTLYAFGDIYNAIRNFASSNPFPNDAIMCSGISERVKRGLWARRVCSDSIMLSVMLRVRIFFLTTRHGCRGNLRVKRRLT